MLASQLEKEGDHSHAQRVHTSNIVNFVPTSLPLPKEASEAMDYFRAMGIPLRSLFLMPRPQTGSVQGRYDRRTGDLWCYEQESRLALLQCLLTLIAHAKLGCEKPSSIEEEWQQMRRAHEEAYALAQAWRPECFSVADLEAFLAADEMFERRHVHVASLVGNRDPALTRRAYQVLDEERRRRGWDEERFETALEGSAAGMQDSRSVLGFDRTRLREGWISTALSPVSALSPFGPLGLPGLPAAVGILRRALQRLALHDGLPPIAGFERTWQPCPAHMLFHEVEHEEDLQQALAFADTLLLREFPTCLVQARWWCYGDLRSRLRAGSPGQILARLYRLEVAYFPAVDMEPVSQRELWCLFLLSGHESSLEAAWQLYIRSWSATQAIASADASIGLQTLFAWLGA